MVQLVEAVVHVRLPGDEVAVYPVTADPPVLVGAVHETTALPSPATPLTPVGALGTVRGVPAIEFEALDGPTEFTDRTVTGYEVPLVNEEMVKDPLVPPELVQVEPPSVEYSTEVTSVVQLPSSDAFTVRDWFPTVTELSVGAEGAVTALALTIMS